MASFLALMLYTLCLYIRPGEWISSFTGVQYAIGLCAGIFLVVELMLGRKKLVNIPQNLLLIGLCLALVLSHAVRFYLAGSVKAAVDGGKNLILFFLVTNCLDSKKKLHFYFSLIIGLTVFLAVQGLVQYKLGAGIGGVSAFGDEGRIRGIGVFNDPNDLALAFVITLPLVLSRILKAKSSIVNVLFLLALTAALVLTNSRGGFLAFVAAMFCYFVARTRKVVPAVLIAALLLFGMMAWGHSRMGTISTAESSAHGRIEAWYEGLQMFKESPLLGVGYDLFTSDYHLTAHNSYVLILAECGFVGLFLWLALIYYSFFFLKVEGSDDHSVLIAVKAGLFGFLCWGFFPFKDVCIYALFAFWP